MRAVPEEAGPGARRVGLGAVGAGRGGLGSSSGVRAQSLRGGHHGAGDYTLLVAHTAAGRALNHTQIHTHGQLLKTGMSKYLHRALIIYRRGFLLVGLSGTNVPLIIQLIVHAFLPLLS